MSMQKLTEIPERLIGGSERRLSDGPIQRFLKKRAG